MEPNLYQMAPERGPRVVAIGGGTGLSTLLRGLKLYTKNITAIVTVSDDGGGSGMLRQDLGMLPPGDIRNCLVALANAEPLVNELMQYRFADGTLAGQSFGNLFLAALNGILSSFEAAVASMSQVLAITGRVLPVTNENIVLEAELENGVRVVGETKIGDCKRRENCRIHRIHLLPDAPNALPAAVQAIEQADLIVLAPGSLYTSVIPNLLVSGIAEAICRSDSLKIYACNIMTQEGETDGYTVSDHVKALLDHGGKRLLDICLVNSAPIPWYIARSYAEKGTEVLLCDQDVCQRLGVEVISRPLATVENGLIRHNPGHLARELIELHMQRSIRVVDTDTYRNKVER